jgi:hypothetical protein
MSAVKKLNIVDIENGLEALSQKNLTPDEYGKELIALFAPSATLKRLGTTKANTSDFGSGILWREKLHYVPCKAGELNEVIEKAKASDQTLKAKVRLVVVNDGSHILVFDRKYNELTDCTIETVKDEPQLFLPLTGQEGFRREEENEVDIKATGKLAKFYDALIEKNPDWLKDDKRHVLNHFVTQIIFCLFAEDTGIFPTDIFTKTLKNRAGSNGEQATAVIAEIYSVLDLNDTQRTETSAWQNEFPYVNGGLFSGDILIPEFTPKAYRYLLEASSLDWKHINPDILGSSIQAIVDPTMRGNLGMHYTSVPNILKTIEPLFLNDLRDELFKARHSKKLINSFLERLSNIVLFDPACGSGNFLVIAYRELRKLELQAIDALRDLDGGSSMAFGFNSVISLSNFYGIEYADFAAETAKLALWIAEYQQNSRFIAAFGKDIPSLPLRDSGNIMCANSLRVSWNEFCDFDDSREVHIVSNPPYLGARDMDKEQKEDLKIVFGKVLNGFNNLDYVTAWFWKSRKYCEFKNRDFALVSTKTLVQGIHIGKFWRYLLNGNIEISFAYRSFEWSNNAADKAGVTCVIVGMSNQSNKGKTLFTNNEYKVVENINAYLLDMPNYFVKDESKPINGMPAIFFGNMPNDGGSLLLTEEEKNKIIEKYPEAAKFIKKMLGSYELINNIKRYCVWIEDEDLENAICIPAISERVAKCRENREKSNRKATNKLAVIPHKFGEIRQVPCDSLLAIPSISSSNREYLPVDILTKGEIISNKNFGVHNGELWMFSIIASKLFILWVSTVCVRLRNDYSLSNTLGWNTFPIPVLNTTQKERLSAAGRDILLARESHFPLTIAELYNKEKFPKNLKNAHERNDELLESMYKGAPFFSHREKLFQLFESYNRMTQGEEK